MRWWSLPCCAGSVGRQASTRGCVHACVGSRGMRGSGGSPHTAPAALQVSCCSCAGEVAATPHADAVLQCGGQASPVGGPVVLLVPPLWARRTGSVEDSRRFAQRHSKQQSGTPFPVLSQPQGAGRAPLEHILCMQNSRHWAAAYDVQCVVEPLQPRQLLLGTMRVEEGVDSALLPWGAAGGSPAAG